LKIHSKNTFLVLTGVLLLAFGIISVSQSPKAAEQMAREEIEAIVKDYIMKNPGIIIEAFQAYQINQEQEQKSQFEAALEESGEFLFDQSLPWTGNPDGDVTIVEFFDYNCGYCKRAYADLQKVLENDKNVKVVFLEMPILSSSSSIAARYSLASYKQGMYFEYHGKLMEFQGNKNEEALERIATDLGMDVGQLKKDANSKETREKIEAFKEVSRKLGIRGTPAFIIGDTLAPGYMGWQDMLRVIEEVRNGEG
jgi:protein-disulfide isomerase